MRVKEICSFLRFVCKCWVCRVAGFMKLVYLQVWWCLMLFLWGSFAYCPLKVNSVESHVVALSEFHRIFANIWVVIGAFWSASTFRVFNIFCICIWLSEADNHKRTCSHWTEVTFSRLFPSHSVYVKDSLDCSRHTLNVKHSLDCSRHTLYVIDCLDCSRHTLYVKHSLDCSRYTLYVKDSLDCYRHTLYVKHSLDGYRYTIYIAR